MPTNQNTLTRKMVKGYRYKRCLNAWVKPSARLVRGSCGIPMTTG